MSNKKVLSQATKELNKVKAPSKPRDIIYDPMGYWNPNNQGQPVRIPGNGKGTNITMGPNPETGTPIPYPVWALPNVGQPQMMYPGQNYNFPEADYVDEYPQMKKGGLKKNKTSRSLMATNKLFAKHAFFKKPGKNVIFDPNSPNFQDGGEQDAMNAMMKARLAYANEFGNPAAKRMINIPDNPYQFEDGNTGTHYMASMDNYAVPQIQEENGQLMLGDYDPSSNEAMRFDRPEDAEYFAEHYKDVSPGFIETELSDDEIEEYRKGGYIVEDISVPEINQYAKGGGKKKKKETTQEQEPGIVSKTPFQPGTYDPNEMAGSMVNLSAATKSAEAPMWVGFANEYEKKHSKQAFIDAKKRDYLKHNKGLNKAAGVSMENFPEKVLQNFANEYDYHKNNYVTKRLGKEKGFNPRNRGEWVEQLSPGEKKAVENSRYGSKLQASAWDRSLAGLKNIGSYIDPDIGKIDIPGLTKSEQAKIQNSKLGALETFAVADLPGNAIANFVKNRGMSTGSNYKELPSVLSGDKMSNVSDMEAMALNPLTYAGLEALPELGVNAARMGYKGLKAGYKGAKNFKAIPKIAASADNVGNVAKTIPTKTTSGTLNAGVSPELLKNVTGASNKVGANLLDQAYFSPFLNKTLNKISPLNYIPGYGKKLEGAVKPLGNVINKNIKNGNLVEQQGIIGKAKNLIGKGTADPITTKLNRTSADIYAAKFDDAAKNSDIVLGDPMKQGVIGRTFNKKNAITPLQSKTTGKPLTEISLSDNGVSLKRRLPFSNRYVDVDKQKLLNNEFQWSTTGAGLQNVAEKFGKSIPVWGGIGATGAALTYDPYSDITDDAKKVMQQNNITIEDLQKKDLVPTRMETIKEGFNNSIISPEEFLSNPDPYFLRTIGRAVGFEEGGYVDAELTDEEIEDYKRRGYVIEELD